MIPWVRILLYFTIFTLIIIKLQKKNSSLTPIETVAAFALKVILGSAYGYIHLRFYNGDDTTMLHLTKDRIARIHNRYTDVSTAVITCSIPRASHINGRTSVLTKAAGAALM